MNKQILATVRRDIFPDYIILFFYAWQSSSSIPVVQNPTSLLNCKVQWNPLSLMDGPVHTPLTLLRPVHTRELAPETRSRVSTPTSTDEGHDEGACSRSTLLQNAPGAKPPRLHQRFLAKKYVAQQNFAPDFCTSFHGKQISVHTREIAPETDSCNRFSLELAPSYQTSLIWGSKTREQKFCCATYFLLEIVGADEGAERVAEAYCGSKLPRVYRPLRSHYFDPNSTAWFLTSDHCLRKNNKR